jgi:D-amino-acid dehydrogenase
MQILVLGSGIIGTTTAYYLAKQGHSVTVVDRQSGAGLETSFANAGQISPGYAAPWAAPGIPLKAIKWMIGRYSPLVVNPRPDWEKIKFIAKMLMNCNSSSYSINKGRMLRLAEYSRTCLQQLQQETGISYDAESKGTLQLFRTHKQLNAAQKDIALLEQYQVPYELLDADACVAVEPGLNAVKHKIVGGLRLILDQTGDCFKLTEQLVGHCKQLGVNFRFDTNILSINMDQGEIRAVSTDAGDMKADRYVMAMGSYSTKLLKQIGINSPVYPVKGYSITLPVINEKAAPVSTIMDETYKVAITRLGDRIRVAGTAELNGYDLALNDKRRGTIHHVVSDLFPDGVDMSEDNFWTGLRPMTPDGTPLIGATKIDNLFLNTGHGTLGWTMSFGSARLLSDIISGNKANIDHEDLSISRYAGSLST